MKHVICVSIVLSVSLAGVCRADSAVGERIRDLRSSVPAVRRQAAVSLGRIGDRSAVLALIEALKDPQNGVRREAAKSLGFIKDARAVTPLLKALGDRDMNVRLYAAYALGEIKTPQAGGALLKALGDPAWCVRDQAAWALREIHDPKIISPLVAELKQANADVEHIVWLLRHTKGAHTGEHLAKLLKDADAKVRGRAVLALGELKNPRAVEPLIAALDDENPVVRLGAVKALLNIGDDRAEQPFKELAAKEKDPFVRKAAEQAVLQMSRRGDLVAHWSFDDRNTTLAKDVTSGGSDGEIQGCQSVEGKVGHALRFSKGKYIALGKPAGVPIAGKPLTITAWVKSDAKNGVVIARGGASCGFSLYIKDGVAKFGIHRVSDGPAFIAAGRDDVVGSWVHLAGVVKRDRVELYVNGKLAAKEKTNGYIPGNCGQGMEIGYDVSNSPAEITDNFQGVIDEVKVYQSALSADDIAKQYVSEK